jgi:hypothetical protein
VRRFTRNCGHQASGGDEEKNEKDQRRQDGAGMAAEPAGHALGPNAPGAIPDP